MSNFSDLFGEISKDLNKGFETLNKSVSDLLNNATGAEETQDTATTNKAGFTVPLINIVETPDSFRVEVAAPGYEKKNFKLQIENDALIIKGKKTAVQENKGETYLMQEHKYDEFKRSFSLNEKINATKITAAYKDGILYVTLGKKNEFIQAHDLDIDIF
ncbi:MAG: Hsp20/alpha crystallin family protein [Chitinophagales bacterium]